MFVPGFQRNGRGYFETGGMWVGYVAFETDFCLRGGGDVKLEGDVVLPGEI